jgi:hypothetical protein
LELYMHIPRCSRVRFASPIGLHTRQSPVPEANVMFSEERSDWRQLCKLTAKETDFSKLMELTAEIVRLLDEQQKESMAVGLTN